MTRISEIDALLVNSPVKRPFAASALRGVHTSRSSILVRVTADDGAIGWGETFPALSTPAAGLLETLRESLAPRLLGRNPLEIGVLRREMQTAARGLGTLAIRGMSALDTALWDLAGQIQGVSVSTLLGAGRDAKFPAVATAIFYDPQRPEEAAPRAEQAARLVAEGYRAVKVKVGALSPKTDVEHVRAIREAIGDDVMLSVDANSGYARATARAIVGSLTDLGVYWFEEPVPIEDVAGYRAVADAGIATAGGQDLPDAASYLPLLRADALDLVQPSVAAAGGISGVREVATVAGAFGAGYCPTGWGTTVLIAASLHLRNAIRRFAALPFPDLEWIEYDVSDNPLRDALVTCGPQVREGFIAVPDGPGLGITVDQDTVRRLQVDGWSLTAG